MLTYRIQGIEPGIVLCNGKMETDETPKRRHSKGSIYNKGFQRQLYVSVPNFELKKSWLDRVLLMHQQLWCLYTTSTQSR